MLKEDKHCRDCTHWKPHGRRATSIHGDCMLHRRPTGWHYLCEQFRNLFVKKIKTK